MPKYDNLLIHTLAFGAGTKTERELNDIAERAAVLGASGLELLFHPMPVLPAKTVAKVFREHGLRRASLCLFFPNDPSQGLGDPTDIFCHRLARKHILRAVQYVHRLQDAGIEIEVIDGPLNIVLGRPAYEYLEHASLATLQFAEKHLAPIGGKEVVVFCSEPLQRGEDNLIHSAFEMNDFVLAVDSPWFLLHLDTFHTVKNGEKLLRVLKKCGWCIGHLHLNGIGKDHAREGRIPCGCRDFLIDGKSYTDSIPWERLHKPFDEVALAAPFLGMAPLNTLICLEPFHEDACQAIPPLREGVVPVTDDSQLCESVKNLAAAGFLIENGE